jgi:signal transduction histidine kinase
MLLGLAALTIVGILVLTVFSADITSSEMVQMVAALVAAAVGVVVIYALNRWWSGDLAGTLFVSLLLIVVVVSDTPRQVVEGRTLIIFTIPILMASVVIRPWASFATAGVSSAIITVIAQFRIGILPPVPSMLGFFAFALVAWLSARSLEDALRDLRTINRQLDQMVEERTRELQEANEELAEANEHLREMDRLKSRFLSMVSHDLRTPLGAIQGFSELLQAEVYGPLLDKQENAIERIRVNAKQLLHLVNDLLDQARIEAGGLTLHPESFSPAELIEDLVSTMGVLAESEGLTLTTTIDDDVPERLWGDKKRLHQILVNLVNNAIKFTEEGGIHIRVYLADDEPSHWAIAVTDTGPGISEEDQGYIFEPFRRVDDSITRSHGGVGLGLSIVKQLTTLMGGDIALDSEKGQGSTFTVALPLEE